MPDDTRSQIIDAAGAIFAEHGFDMATVRDICASAGVNVASINYHFGDKESLYIETVTRAHQFLLQKVPVPQWSATTLPEKKLGLFVRAVLTRMLGSQELGWPIRLMMREMFQPTVACKSLVEDYIRPQHQLLKSILEEMLPGDVQDYYTAQIAFSIIGQCLLYRVAGQFVDLLVTTQQREAHYQLEQLAEHITQFSIQAVHGLASHADNISSTANSNT